MASFKEFRQTLLLYYDANLISDEDFIFFYELFSSRNPEFAYNAYNRFDLDEMNDDECNAKFILRKRDLPTLAQALNKILLTTCYSKFSLKIQIRCRYQ